MTRSSKASDQTGSEKIDIVQSFFDQPRHYLDRRRYDIRVRTETAKAFLEGRSYKRILDIGCGDGSVSVPLLSSQCHLTLLDISPNMLSAARSRVPSNLAANVAFVEEDFLKAPFEKESYDVVVCMGVLAHVASPSDVVGKIAVLLKPGGTLILECTDSFHFMGRLIVFYHWLLGLCRPFPYGLNLLSSAGVSSMAEKHGLHQDAVFRYSLPLPGSHRIFSQSFLYHFIRAIFGDAKHNRNAWLGNEHIFCLSRR